MDCTESLKTTGMVSVRLDCSGGGGTVMFCGRFASGDCISDRTLSVVIRVIAVRVYAISIIGVHTPLLPLP